MNRRWFINRMRSMFNIDAYQLPELDESQLRVFLDDPLQFFMNDGNEDVRGAIWREVEKRQSRAREDACDRIHAIAIQNCIVLPEPVVRDMVAYLSED